MHIYLHRLITIAFFITSSFVYAQVNWSAPRPAGGYMELPSTKSLLPRLATNDTGGVLSVRLIGSSSHYRANRVVSSYSGDFGQTWTTTTLVNDWETSETMNPYPGYPPVFVPVAADAVYAGNNIWLCQWLSHDDSTGAVPDTYLTIAKSVDNGLNWDTVLSTMTVPMAEVTGNYLDMATDGSGKVISTWARYEIGPMYMMRSDDFGNNWSEPFQPHDSSLKVKETRLAWANGTWYHVFSPDSHPEVSFNARSLEVARSIDGGHTWDRTELHWQLGGSFTNMMGDVAAVNDTVAISYLQTHPSINGSTAYYEARVIHSTDSGITWTAPAVLDIIPSRTELAIATDREGQWVVLTNPYVPGEIRFERHFKIYRTSDIATTWTSTEISNPNQTHTITFPCLLSPAPSVFMAHYVNSKYSFDEPSIVKALNSTDGGTSWSDLAFPNDFAPYYFFDSRPQNLRAKVEDNGTIVATWSSDFEDGVNSTIARSVDMGKTWDLSKAAGPAADSRDTSATSSYGTSVNVSFPYYSSSPDTNFNIVATSTFADGSSQTSVLDTFPIPAKYYTHYPKMAAAWLGERQWIAVWEKKLSGLPTDYLSSRIFYSVSDDDGRNWSAAQRITASDSDLPPGTGQNFPTIAANNGRTIAMWQVTRGDTFANPAEGDSDINFSVVEIPIVPPAETADWVLY